MAVSLFLLSVVVLGCLVIAASTADECTFFADERVFYTRADLEACFARLPFDRSDALSLIDNVRLFADMSSEKDRLRAQTDTFADVYLDYDAELAQLREGVATGGRTFATEFELHAALTDIFRKARDPHFMYTAPACFGGFQFILPFSFEAREVDGTTRFFLAPTVPDAAAFFRAARPEEAAALDALVGHEITAIDGVAPAERVRQLASTVSFTSKSLGTRVSAVLETEFHMGTTYFGWPHEDAVVFTVEGSDSPVTVPFIYASLQNILSTEEFLELCNAEPEVSDASLREFVNMRPTTASASSVMSSLALNRLWKWKYNCRSDFSDRDDDDDDNSAGKFMECSKKIPSDKKERTALWCLENFFPSMNDWGTREICGWKYLNEIKAECKKTVQDSGYGDWEDYFKSFGTAVLASTSADEPSQVRTPVSSGAADTSDVKVTHIFDVQESLISYDIVAYLGMRIGVLWFGSFDPAFDVGAVQSLMQEVARTNPDRLVVDVRGNTGGYVTLGNQLAWWINSEAMRPSAGIYRRRLDPLTKRLYQAGLGSLLGDVQDYLTHDEISWDRVLSGGERVTLVDRVTGEEISSDYTSAFTIEAYEWFDKDGNMHTLNESLGQPALEMEPAAVIVLTNGQCGSACATFAWNMRELGGARFVNVGGLWEGGAISGDAPGFASFPGGTVVDSSMVTALVRKLGMTPGQDGVPAPLLHGASLSIPWLTMYSRREPARALEWMEARSDMQLQYHSAALAAHGFYDGAYAELMDAVAPLFVTYGAGDVALTADCANTTAEVRGRRFRPETGLFDGECVRLYCAEPFHLDFATGQCVQTPAARSLRVAAGPADGAWRVACIVLAAVLGAAAVAVAVAGAVRGWWPCCAARARKADAAPPSPAVGVAGIVGVPLL